MTMVKILFVEDDFYLRRDVRTLLQQENYQVIAAADGREAEQVLLKEKDIALFLLDLWLPDMDGFELLEKVRSESHAPVLFLTACDDEPSVIRALDLGADDYITKPFRQAELLSRIRANLRRMNTLSDAEVLESDGLVLNLSSHEVRLHDVPLSLRPTEYRLLELFMQNPGILLKRDRLLSALDRESLDELLEDNTLTVQISRLRKAIPKELIETVRGFGYRFTGTVNRNRKG